MLKKAGISGGGDWAADAITTSVVLMVMPVAPPPIYIRYSYSTPETIRVDNS